MIRAPFGRRIQRFPCFLSTEPRHQALTERWPAQDPVCCVQLGCQDTDSYKETCHAPRLVRGYKPGPPAKVTLSPSLAWHKESLHYVVLTPVTRSRNAAGAILLPMPWAQSELERSPRWDC